MSLYFNVKIYLLLLNSLEEIGLTWDSSKNNLIKVILPFDNRKFRLDRILLHKMNDLFKLKSIEVEGIETICSYLNISDHYLIVACI